jgi:hypothetical protein
LRGRTESSIFVLRAIKWNFVNLGKTLKKRRLVQAKRKISDSEIFKQVAKPINWKKFFGDLKRIEKDVSSN